jgi:hypothetical protein
MDEATLTRALLPSLDQPPEQLVDIICDRLAAHAINPDEMDRSILIVKRLPE